MPVVIALDDLQSSPTAALFEGREHADVDISTFVTAHPPGAGPVLHRHPYPEVFVVLEGLAAFVAGDEQVQVAGGHVVVVPARTPHRFENAGTGTLRIVSVHPSGHVQQEDLPDG